jgi:hypothetical protein
MLHIVKRITVLRAHSVLFPALLSPQALGYPSLGKKQTYHIILGLGPMPPNPTQRIAHASPLVVPLQPPPAARAERQSVCRVLFQGPEKR